MEFNTTDIVLAAYLRLNNCHLIRIDKEGQKGTFVFSEVKQRLIDDFDCGRAAVEPVAFNNTIKQLTTSVRRTA